MPQENWTDIHKDFGKWHVVTSTSSLFNILNNKTYQQEWEENSLTYQDAQEWISLGFKPSDYYSVEGWKNHNLTPQEAKSWIDKGLNSWNGYKFAFWLKQKNIQPHNLPKTIKELRAEYWLNTNYPQHQTKEIKINDSENLQGSLIIIGYPNLEKLEIQNQKNLTNLQISNCTQLKELNVLDSKLTNLDLTSLLNLETIKLSNNSFTSLNLNNNKKLKKLDVSSNKLTDLGINHLKDLKELNVWNNNLTELKVNNLVNLKKLSCSRNLLNDLDLSHNLELEELGLSNNNFVEQDLLFVSHLTNLKGLSLGNWDEEERIRQSIYNRFYGSLEFLKDLNELETLDISNTDIDSGLEYLPESVEKFSCSADLRKEAKVKAIYNLFASEQGKVETDEHESIISFPQKLQEYKQWRKLNFTEEEIKSWIGIGLKINDYDFAKQWKEKSFTAEQTKKSLGAEAQLDDHLFINWLKNLTPEWITNNQETYQNLSQRFKEYGLCPDCQQPKNTKYWCRSCNSSGSSEVDDFIEKYQLKATNYKGILEWIPYDKLTVDSEPIGKGGFGKIYKAKWFNENNKQKLIALKSLNESVKVKEDFLQEIANHKMFVSNRIVKCLGISQDPNTKNYLMVMDYVKDGDLRKFLQHNQLDFKSKLAQLWRIADGLKDVHKQNLTHRDFHSGNILNRSDKIRGVDDVKCYITDLGLCRPANVEDKAEVYGQIPYVAPEILSKDKDELASYTQASDIYSFGIVAYELFAVCPPYNYSSSNVSHQTSAETLLIAEIISKESPRRPDLDIIPLPRLLKDLIKKCWDASPQERPTAIEIVKTLNNWRKELNEKDTEFTQQVQVIEETYNKMLQDKKYPPVNLFSKPISTGSISSESLSRFSSKSLSEYYETRELEFDINTEELANSTKRQLSTDSQTKTNQGETKQFKTNEQIEYYSEPMEIDYNWQNIHSNFTPELIQQWANYGFTYSQTQDWINIIPQSQQPQAIQEPEFYTWLRDNKNLTPEQALNHHNLENLKIEFHQIQQTPQILHDPPKNV